MSIKVMTWVWEHAAVNKGSLLVLLALADFADDEGKCYPATPTLAKKARLEERQVQRVVKQLIQQELLDVQWNKGPNGVNVYRVRQNVGGDIGVLKMSHKPSGTVIDDDDLKRQFSESSSSKRIGRHFRQRLCDIFGTDAVDGAYDSLKGLPIRPYNPEGWLIAHLRGKIPPLTTADEDAERAWLARRYREGKREDLA